MKSRAPICLLLRPSATRCATSASLLPSIPGPGCAATNSVCSPSASATAASRLSAFPLATSESNLARPNEAVARLSSFFADSSYVAAARRQQVFTHLQASTCHCSALQKPESTVSRRATSLLGGMGPGYLGGHSRASPSVGVCLVRHEQTRPGQALRR